MRQLFRALWICVASVVGTTLPLFFGRAPTWGSWSVVVGLYGLLFLVAIAYWNMPPQILGFWFIFVVASALGVLARRRWPEVVGRFW